MIEKMFDLLTELSDEVAGLARQLTRLEAKLAGNEEPEENWWAPAEVAERVGRAALTIREWARLGKIPSTTDSRGRRWISDEVAQLIFRYRGLPPEEELTLCTTGAESAALSNP